MSKYPRTYHFPFSAGVTNDDRVADSMSNLVGCEIVITEKLDGSNASLTKNGVYGRSHADFSKNPWDREMWLIHDRIKFDIPEDVFIFGENMEGIHSITYNNLTSYFYIFGIRDGEIWLPWESVEEWSYLLDLPTVPVLFKGQVTSEKELKDLHNDIEIKKNELSALAKELSHKNNRVKIIFIKYRTK